MFMMIQHMITSLVMLLDPSMLFPLLFKLLVLCSVFLLGSTLGAKACQEDVRATSIVGWVMIAAFVIIALFALRGINLTFASI